MPKKDPTQEALLELRAMAQDAPSAVGIGRLRALLGHRSNHVVGRAATLAGEWKAEEAIPELLAAFDRFLESPVKRDPTCAAKRAIVGALIALGHREAEVYVQAAHHVQMEPVYGGSEDTAATLRGAAGEGLLGCRYSEGYLELASLLLDPDPRTRRMAIESLGRTETPEAELMLRMAVLADRMGALDSQRSKFAPNEEDADIIALGLQGLMAIAPGRSLDFVATFLRSPKATVAEGAALAIGEARMPESFSVLRAAWGQAEGPDELSLLLPMALTRDDEAIEFLLQVVENEPTPCAAAAVEALAIYRSDATCLARVSEAVVARESRPVTAAYKAAFEA